MTVQTLENILRRDQNNFDLLRTFAAMAVIFGHAFVLHPTNGWPEPVTLAFSFTYSGALAVDVFFFLSGMLIAASFCQGKSISRFVIMRFFRIWPGLFVCLVLTAFVIGPLVTSMPLLEYLKHWETRWYVINNIQLHHISYSLPGVFVENHYKNVANGSLWTLPIEIRCYLLVLIFGAIGGFKKKIYCAGLAAVMIIFLITDNVDLFRPFLVFEAAETRMPLLFTMGMFTYVYRSHIRIDWRISILALALAVAFKTTLIGIAATYLFVLNSALAISATRRSGWAPPGDYSYGIYIYGFIVQQSVAHYHPRMTAYESLALSIPFSLVLAILSWHFVERPALTMARNLTRWLDHKRKSHAVET